MNKVVIGVIALFIIIGAGVGGWYFFLKKIPEGGVCAGDQKCDEGLKCVRNVCSSGKVASPCNVASDCKTASAFCVKNVCTEGKAGEACATYKDCQSGLLCKSAVCAAPPSYAKYFDKIQISKMRPDMPPGPNNIPVPTTEFRAGDGLEIDVTLKPEVQGEFYAVVLDPVSGEKIVDFQKQNLTRQGLWGTGTRLPDATGDFEIDVYFKGELVYSIPIKIR